MDRLTRWITRVTFSKSGSTKIPGRGSRIAWWISLRSNKERSSFLSVFVSPSDSCQTIGDGSNNVPIGGMHWIPRLGRRLIDVFGLTHLKKEKKDGNIFTYVQKGKGNSDSLVGKRKERPSPSFAFERLAHQCIANERKRDFVLVMSIEMIDCSFLCLRLECVDLCSTTCYSSSSSLVNE